jgi:hypothetical protein
VPTKVYILYCAHISLKINMSPLTNNCPLNSASRGRPTVWEPLPYTMELIEFCSETSQCVVEIRWLYCLSLRSYCTLFSVVYTKLHISTNVVIIMVHFKIAPKLLQLLLSPLSATTTLYITSQNNNTKPQTDPTTGKK